jgi:ERCC4-type nuclease
VLIVTADVHERASGVPEMLRALGAQVELRSLPRGDYLVEAETVVERKTVADLHSSIAAGRFWAQMRKIRAVKWPYLMIEGASAFTGPVAANSIRALCLAVSDLGIAIIRTEHSADTAEWLLRLAVRRSGGAIRNRPVYAQRLKSAAVPAAEAALACATNVSVETARTVLAHFGSLRQVGEASLDDLQALPGVGVKRATSIAALMHDRWAAAAASSHSAQPNGGRRAT